MQLAALASRRASCRSPCVARFDRSLAPNVALADASSRSSAAASPPTSPGLTLVARCKPSRSRGCQRPQNFELSVEVQNPQIWQENPYFSEERRCAASSVRRSIAARARGPSVSNKDNILIYLIINQRSLVLQTNLDLVNL